MIHDLYDHVPMPHHVRYTLTSSFPDRKGCENDSITSSTVAYADPYYGPIPIKCCREVHEESDPMTEKGGSHGT